MAFARTVLLACLWSATGVTSACADPYEFRLPFTELQYEGKHVRLFTEPGIVPCAGSGPAMDRFVDFLAEELQQGPMSEIVDVHWIRPESYEEFDICNSVPSSAGCFNPMENVVVTKGARTDHELVHAYFYDRADGRPPSFFEEGIAMVYGSETYAPAPWTSVEEGLAESGGIATEHYPRAGHFIAFVVDEFGPEQTGRLMVALAGLPADKAGGVFEAVLGERLDDFVERYKAESVRCDSDAWHRPPECSAEPVPFRTDAWWEGVFDLNCEDGDAIGEVGDRSTQTAALSLPSAGKHQFGFIVGTEGEREPAQGYSVALIGCGGCEAPLRIDLPIHTDSPDSPFETLYGIQLDAGQYYVEIVRDAGVVTKETGVRVSLTITQ